MKSKTRDTQTAWQGLLAGKLFQSMEYFFRVEILCEQAADKLDHRFLPIARDLAATEQSLLYSGRELLLNKRERLTEISREHAAAIRQLDACTSSEREALFPRKQPSQNWPPSCKTQGYDVPLTLLRFWGSTRNQRAV